MQVKKENRFGLREIIGLCIRGANSDQLTNMLQLFVGIDVGPEWSKSVLPYGIYICA